MNGGLIYGISTLAIGLFALLIRYSFKSKCSDVSLCCGLITIHRDIEQEIQGQKMESNHSPSRELSLRNLSNV